MSMLVSELLKNEVDYTDVLHPLCKVIQQVKIWLVELNVVVISVPDPDP